MQPIRRSQNWLPGIFNDFFGNEWVEKVNVHAPAINILENEDNFKIEIAAPGLTKDDFTIKLENDNEMVVSMEKKQEKSEEGKKGKYLRREFNFTQFQQRMILPENVDMDKIEAKSEHGVLNIVIPKRSPQEEVKKEKIIEIG